MKEIKINEDRKLHELIDIGKMIENNTKFKDNSSKIFLKNAILCAQFLRDYVKIPLLKKVKPEDIEDVTERYTPLFTSEREADTIKKIKLDGGISLFLISLIEHKTKVDYNLKFGSKNARKLINTGFLAIRLYGVFHSFWEEIKVYKNFRISTQVVVSSVASVVFPGVYDTLFLGSYQKLYRML